MKKVVILGVGLMGGSLGMALRMIKTNSRRKYSVLGIGRNVKSLRLGVKKGALDNFSVDIKDASGADIVVICLPVDMIVSAYTEIAKFCTDKTIVCDIGSVKLNVDAEIKSVIRKNANYPVFVGCHPMAGTEKNGVKFADSGIYRGARVIVTETKRCSSVKTVTEMWEDIGCKVVFMSAREHDKIAAFTSHLTHIIAFNFYRMFKEKNSRVGNMRNMSAGSFNSITRVAKSSPGVWTPIFINNKENLRKLIEEFCVRMRKFADMLDDGSKIKKILSRSINNENKQG